MNTTRRSKFKKLAYYFKFISKIPKNFNDIIFDRGTRSYNVDDIDKNIKSGFSGRPNDKLDSLFLLLGRFDGDLNQSVVELIDLSNFDVLNVYNPDFNMINELVLKNNKELFERIKFDEAEDRRGVKHPILLNDGSILFIGQDSPLIQIDKNSIH